MCNDTCDLADDTPERRALRALQIADNAIPMGVYADNPKARATLMELQSQLGKTLGLECSGSYQGAGLYDHDGDTCPIHEWLVQSDGEPETVSA